MQMKNIIALLIFLCVLLMLYSKKQQDPITNKLDNHPAYINKSDQLNRYNNSSYIPQSFSLSAGIGCFSGFCDGSVHCVKDKNDTQVILWNDDSDSN